MGSPRNGIAGALFLGLLSGCASNESPLLRLLQHRSQEGDTIGGDVNSSLAQSSGWRFASDSPTFWLESSTDFSGSVGWRVTSDPPKAYRDYVPDIHLDGKTLWRRPDPMPFGQAVVGRDAIEEPWGTGKILGPIRTLGWWPERGEWVGELFLHLPKSIPLDLCVDLVVGTTTYETGPLLGGRPGYFPGTQDRSTIRHRIWLNGVSWNKSPADLNLVDCSDGRLLATREMQAPETAQVLNRRDLGRSLEIDAVKGKWAEPEQGARGLRRTKDGVVPVPGPPYPRLRKGEAWPVMVVGPVNPEGWRPARIGTAEAPHARAKPWLDAPGHTVVDLNAPATRVGSPIGERGNHSYRPRRIAPDWLKVLNDSGVDIVMLTGNHVGDAGPLGETQTGLNVRALGLGLVGTSEPYIFSYQIQEHDRVGAIVSLPIAGQLREEEVAIHKRMLDDLGDNVDTLLVQVNPKGTAWRNEEIAQALASEAVDGLWFVGGEEWGAIDVIGTTTVVYAVPEFPSMQGDTGGALRWYLGDQGVERLDIVALTQNNQAQWVREDPKRAALWFEGLARKSRRYGTYVRVGQNIATVDVAGHWPSKDDAVGARIAITNDVSADFEIEKIPERCVSSLKSDGRAVLFGDGAKLHAWSIVQSKSNGTRPFVVMLQWSRRPGGTTLLAGEIELKAAFQAGSIRQRHQPCDDSWGFERFEEDVIVQERVFLWPPVEAQSGTSDLWMTVRLGNTVQRTSDGERKLNLGKIQLDKSEKPR